jgi:hypothetical protein
MIRISQILSVDNEEVTDLREPLLLQISNNALPKQSGSLDNVQHFLIIVLQQRQLEPILCWIESDSTRAS